ncbi:hypothetical protein [Kingella oralis]|uniref:hypothetical protein n=1 Tax=Kingella oralis TaxID=505 RepID=UPI0034E3EBFA
MKKQARLNEKTEGSASGFSRKTRIILEWLAKPTKRLLSGTIRPALIDHFQAASSM